MGNHQFNLIKQNTSSMNFNIEYNKKSFNLNNTEPTFVQVCAMAEDKFSLRPDSYQIYYLDIDGDEIAIQDDDDLAVCILEFSEMSKIDDPINLRVEPKEKLLPRRRDTPKGSRDNSSEKKTIPESVVIQSVLVDLPPKKTDQQDCKSEVMRKSCPDFAETGSVLSEQMLSTIDTKVSEKIEKLLPQLLEERLAKAVEEKLGAKMAEIDSKVDAQFKK